MSKAAPGYDAHQSSFHEAFEWELRRIVEELSIPENGRVIDVPCGNGFYSKLLASLLGATHRLTAVDACDEYLNAVRKEVRGAAEIEVVNGSAYELPFEAESFDHVWCAQSLISLDPQRVIREFFRAVKPHGIVSILEMDEFHHVLLPWPAELEAALPLALHEACVQKYGDGIKLAPTRKLRGILAKQGFRSIYSRVHVFERSAPFDPLTRTFLERQFKYLRSFAYPHLSSRLQKTFDHAIDGDSPDSLLRRSDVEMACLNSVYTARR